MKYEATKVLFEICCVVLTLIITSPLTVPMIYGLFFLFKERRAAFGRKKTATRANSKVPITVKVKKGERRT